MFNLLSGGRLRLGVGLGWNYVEYEALGQDFHTRGVEARGADRTSSSVVRPARRRVLWSFRSELTGLRWYQNRPDPSRSGSVDPARKAFDRAARLADGFIFFGGGVDHAIASWSRQRDSVSDLGRSVEDFGGDYVALSGADVGVLTSEIDTWREAGGTHATVVTMGLGLDSVGEHIDYLASLAGTLELQ